MPYRQITLEERYHLASLRALRATPSAIARALGRHPSTIRRELARNRTAGGPYRPYPAECYARTRRSHSRRNRRLTPADWQQVLDGLRLAWSPEQIAGRGRRTGTLRISHETIYRYLWYDRQAGGTLYRLLRGSQKQRRQIGHWAIDAVAGARTRDCLLSLVERKTGYLLLGKLADHTAATFTARCLQLLGTGPHPVRTITADNGSELAGYRTIEEEVGAVFYFATPYHAWERGTNENTNGLIRQFAPKRQSLAGLTQRDCTRIAERLNTRPRKRLGYETPEECYRREA